MRRRHTKLGATITAILLSSSIAQVTAQSPAIPDLQSGTVPSPTVTLNSSAVPALAVTSATEQLLAFRNSDVKFDLHHLMGLLRDKRHEGWVLAAYPDPKTGDPLIGAGFTLSLPARAHLQRDPLNPHPFLEPSSAELWQAAGMAPERLQTILDQYNQRLAEWDKKGFRNKIKTLSPQITDEEANLLLRIAAIQAVYNAKAYCRYFDQLTASQQMAMSQLVYQMGVNLEEFTQFLSLINDDSITSPSRDLPATESAVRPIRASGEYWADVQKALIQSQWARLYRTRAVSVIAMLNPRYPENPSGAERLVSATLRPATTHRRRSNAATRLASTSSHPRRPGRRSASRLHKKQSV